MPKLQLTIRDIFVECQFGMHSHGRLAKNLSKVYRGMPLEEFWEQFVQHVKYSMIVFKREPAVERTIDFIAKFCTSLCGGKNNDPPKDDAALGDDEETEMHPFLLKFFGFLLKHHNASDKAVRFRVCQLINKLLVGLGEEAQIDDSLYDQIYQGMLQRLRDKFPVVRMHSVLALARLQDPQDRDCPIISAYLFLLACDNNSDVRRAVLSSIAATTKTLPAIIERTRDTKDLVRKLAYQIISEKIHLRALTIAQRLSLLQNGLNDRSEMVKEACVTRLLQGWLQFHQGNLLDLLECLDVENAPDTCELMVYAIYKKVLPKELVDNFDMLNDELTMNIDRMTCESAFYWRTLATHLHSLGVEATDQLERVLPNGTVLAKFLNLVSEHLKAEKDLEAQMRNEFILQQLLGVVTLLDFSDEFGRREIHQVVRELLLSELVTHTLIKPVVSILNGIIAGEDSLITELAELISDIREPISVVENKKLQEEQRQKDIKLAGIRVQLNQIREDLDEAIHKQEYNEAALLKAKVTDLETTKLSLMDESVSSSQDIRVEKNDSFTLLKCLTIAFTMLEEVNLQSLNPTLQTLLEVLILPGVQNADPAVRNAAVKALGMSCLFSKEAAKTHLLLFMHVAQIDQEAIRVTAIKVIFDFLHIYGLETFEVEELEEDEEASESVQEPTPFEDEEDEDNEFLPNSKRRKSTSAAPKTAGSVLLILTTMLESESSEVRTVAAEGLAKLMLSGRLVSVKVMTRLLLLWYNPITEGDGFLRHCLGAFFPIYAFAGRSNQQILEESFLPTLRTIFNAPATSPISEIDANNVSELVVQLTNAHHLVNKEAAQVEILPHNTLAMKICNEVLKDANSFNVRTLCRSLTLLQLSASDLSSMRDLHTLAERMLKEVRDRQCTKSLQKFHKTVTDLLKLVQSTQTRTSGNLSPVEEIQEETTINQTTVFGDVTGTEPQPDTEDPEILPDVDGNTTGIIRLNTKRNRSAHSTRTKNKQGLSAASKSKKSFFGLDEQSSDSDNLENSVFASPMLTKSKVAPPVAKSTSVTSVAKSKKAEVEDSDSLTSDGEFAPKTRTTRSQGNRTPLSDIENEMK